MKTSARARALPGILLPVAVAATAALLAVALLTPSPAPPPPKTLPSPSPAKPALPDPSRPWTQQPPLLHPPPPSHTPAAASPLTGSAKGAEETMEALLLDERLSHEAVAEGIYELLPRLGPEAQEMAAAHVINLGGEAARRQWMKDLASNLLPPAAASLFFHQLLNEPPEESLPVLRSIASTPSHPFARESAELLEMMEPPAEEPSLLR